MTLSEELTWRGFVKQMTFKDISELDKQKRTFYFGVDPSADSMTIGNLAAAMMVRCFMKHGHDAILLVGGATGMIGDPDGKKQERDIKSLETIAKNKAGITNDYQKVFGESQFTLVDNYDWFKEINYLDFLRDVGKHTSMTQMLDREFVQARIGEGGDGISYAEFSYALIQGYDFLHLYRQHGATLQICGADQWGNSISGVELIRRIEGGEAHVYSCPLIINKATGVKFGKSEEGAVWLSEAKTSVYKFYQFWLNADDAGVIDYLKVYTLLDKAAIDELERLTRENPGARQAQKTLALEVTKLVHGETRAEGVKAVTEVLFGGRDVRELDVAALDDLAQEIPTASAGQLSVVLAQAKLVESNSDFRRSLAGGAISINGQKQTEDVEVSAISLIKKGKNNFVLVR